MSSSGRLNCVCILIFCDILLIFVVLYTTMFIMSFITFFFFFSSRRRHTRSDRDWSSDVCSSDLWQMHPFNRLNGIRFQMPGACGKFFSNSQKHAFPESIGIGRHHIKYLVIDDRSEERRVGKECRSRWSPYH